MSIAADRSFFFFHVEKGRRLQLLSACFKKAPSTSLASERTLVSLANCVEKVAATLSRLRVASVAR